MHRLTSKKYLRIAGIVLGVLILIIAIGGYIAYSKRSALLQSAIYKATAKAKREYNLDVKIGEARFTGLSTVTFAGITVVPFERDTLLHINDLSVSVKLMPLVLGNVKLSEVILKNGFLSLTSKNGVRNFDFLFRKKKDSTTTKTRSGLNELADNLINEVLYKIPDNLDLHNFRITFADDSNQVKLLATRASINDGNLTSTIEVNDREATWHFAGKMHPSDKEIDIKLYADGKKVELPLIEKKFKLKFNFDTLTTRLDKVEHGDNETQVYTYLSVKNMLVNHPALSATDVVVPSGSIDANVFVGDKYVALDSSSVIHVKKLDIHPYLKYKIRPVKMYTVKIHTDWQDAQDFFDSFPQGLFESLDGIQVAGKLRYNAHLFLDTSDPDAVQFESGLAKKDFRILKMGKVDLGRLNREFVYTPYEKGKPMPPRTIGTSNPNFTPITQISPNLRYAVMTAEDPSFLTNNGFVQESLRKSIAEDFKEKRFKRGGSTISMQLVKNAYLSREKTLARKIEETLIVWMIVNNNIMTKNRLLEVYFNIIEWGPNVYGIGEASQYYFGIKPSELTLGQSIFLANIVPKPKAGLYEFLPDGSLRHALVNYFSSLGRLMAGQYLTKPDTSTAYGFYTVRLKESIRRRVAKVDSAEANKIINSSTDDDALGVNITVVPEPVVEAPKKPTFLQRLFGKKDTVAQKTKQQLQDELDQRIKNIDTTGKTKKQIRQEKRQIKQEEADKKKALKDKGLL